MSVQKPKVTFGMIVLNGLPFLPYNLRALYPFAHQIIVVEGAAPGAAGIATPDGHSHDGTLEELRRFARDEDPEGKVVVVTAEDDGHPDGFWPGEKDEQSRAYAARATGEYLWQVDVDEFYLPEAMRTMIETLARDPGITAVTFPTHTFWGSPRCVADGWFLRRGAADYHRLFKWGPGYTYAAHRPPTVTDDRGRDTRDVHWMSARETRALGVVMYHYSLLFPEQAIEKVDYYSHWSMYEGWFDGGEGSRWLKQSYLSLQRPFRVHNVYRYPSWLERFDGPLPPQVEAMATDLMAGRAPTQIRPMDDVEKLLRSPRYRAGRRLLQLLDPLDLFKSRMRAQAGAVKRRVQPRRDGGP